MKTSRDFIHDYPTKYKEGFTDKELKELFSLFPDNSINMDGYNNAVMGDTCMMIDNEIISYHCDVVKGINSGFILWRKEEVMTIVEKNFRNRKIDDLLNEE